MKPVIAFLKHARLVLYSSMFLIGLINPAYAKEIRYLSSGNIQVIFYGSEDQGLIPYNYNLDNFPFEAKTALIDALEIIEATIGIEKLMTVGVIWSGDLDGYSTLAETYTKFGIIAPRGRLSFLNADYKYPREFLNQTTGGFTGENIVMAFNAMKDWNFLKEQKPTIHQQDLITVCLHEMLHGLGISSSFTKFNESKPYIYDQYIVDDNGVAIVDYPTESSRQTALRSNNLYYSGPNILEINNGEPLKLYAPANFSGASICHLDWQYQHDPKGNLLIPGTSYGQSSRYFGDYVLAILEDIGWPIKVDYKNPPDETEAIQEDKIRVYTHENTLHVRNPESTLLRIHIFSASGKLIYARESYTDEAFELLPQNIYIVKVDNRSFKIRMP